jgi:hypothetical protein
MIDLKDILKKKAGHVIIKPSDVFNILEAMEEVRIRTIDLCAETQMNEYKSIGLTNSGKRVNDVIIKLKDNNP